MSKFFVKIATDPDIDPVKCVVGMACAVQAVGDGHDVDVFFAAGGVRNLNPGQFEKMAEKIYYVSKYCTKWITIVVVLHSKLKIKAAGNTRDKKNA